MNKQIHITDLGIIDYQKAWDYQETLLKENVQIKLARGKSDILAGRPAITKNIPAITTDTQAIATDTSAIATDTQAIATNTSAIATNTSAVAEDTQAISTNAPAIATNAPAVAEETTNYLLFCEHPPVYTLGKSGHIENLLINEQQMQEQGISFFPTNRGGDITYHGPGQLVAYPILDLENFITDIGKYLRNLEEIIIRTLAEYGITGTRSAGETGVWLDPEDKTRARKICAMGVRCSRWVTMHGLALNVNTDLQYFNNIIPCGITDKKVASMQEELGREVPLSEIKEKLQKHFADVFGAEMIQANAYSAVK